MNDLPHIPLEFSQKLLDEFCVTCVNHISDKLTNFQDNQNFLDRVAIGSNLGTPNPHVKIHIKTNFGKILSTNFRENISDYSSCYVL